MKQDDAKRDFAFERVGWDDPRARRLREVMDDEIYTRYADRITSPEIEAEVVAALTVDPATILATVLVLERDGTPIGHAALRLLGGEWEVKRVVVLAGQRRRGIARALMEQLEAIAREANATRLILQTGDQQPEAVTLYERLGYIPIPIYEPYVQAIPYSLCFEKILGSAHS